MLNPGDTTVIKIAISSKLKHYCDKNKLTISKVIRDAIEKLFNSNPTPIFKRSLGLTNTTSVRLTKEDYDKYIALREFFTTRGIGILIHDSVINENTYDATLNITTEIESNILDSTHSIDATIAKDPTLTDKQKRFLISLDMEEKEIFYNDRDLLDSVEIGDPAPKEE